MAVPKKRTSKSKRNIRKAGWRKKADFQTSKAFSSVQAWVRVLTEPLPALQLKKREFRASK